MTKEGAGIAIDSTQLVRSLFALIPIPVAVVDDAERVILANSAFSDLFPNTPSIESVRRHELQVDGRGIFELETVPLNDQGLKIVYATEITNEVQLRRQVVHLEKIAATGRIKPRRIAFDLNDTIRNVVQLRECRESADHIVVTTDLGEKLPYAWGDPGQMAQVFLNLVVNAEDAIAEAPRRPGTIHIQTSLEGEFLQVTITDNGSGIHARDMARIFHPFFTTKEKNRGAGLGLSICAEIVKDHGGDLYAWSSCGKGSTFTLELPVRHEIVPEEIQPVRSTQNLCLRGKQILVIDDEVHITELIFDVLSRQGARIDLANSSVEALDQIKKNNYDVIICDQRMPGVSGQRLYRLVQLLNPELRHRFLFVTGDVVNAESKRFFTQAGVQYIRKPFRIDELVDSIECLLSRTQPPGF